MCWIPVTTFALRHSAADAAQCEQLLSFPLPIPTDCCMQQRAQCPCRPNATALVCASAVGVDAVPLRRRRNDGCGMGLKASAAPATLGMRGPARAAARRTRDSIRRVDRMKQAAAAQQAPKTERGVRWRRTEPSRHHEPTQHTTATKTRITMDAMIVHAWICMNCACSWCF